MVRSNGGVRLLQGFGMMAELLGRATPTVREGVGRGELFLSSNNLKVLSMAGFPPLR